MLKGRGMQGGCYGKGNAKGKGDARGMLKGRGWTGSGGQG